MTIEEKRDKISAILDEMETGEIICAWNQRCDNYNDFERHIYYMGEFNEVMCDVKPLDIVEALDGNFNSMDDYFCDDIYGLSSFDDIYDIVDDDELIEYIMEEDDDVDNPEIREILDEEEEDEDEEEEED